jgi:hypothetical protein
MASWRVAGDNASNGEVVCVTRSLVAGTAVELAQGRLCCAHVLTKRHKGVAPIDSRRIDDFRRCIRQRAAAGKWDKMGTSFAHLGIGGTASEGAGCDDGQRQRQTPT